MDMASLILDLEVAAVVAMRHPQQSEPRSPGVGLHLVIVHQAGHSHWIARLVVILVWARLLKPSVL